VCALLAMTSLGALCAACGGSNDSSTSSTTLLVTYGKDPTDSAKMVCAPEAQTDLAAALGAKTTSVTTPTWTDHVYRCTYDYADGSFTLAVKELPTIDDTVDFYNAEKSKHPVSQLLDLGQGGFVSTDDTAVVRKDNKVLVVDVDKLPAQFGKPAQNRADTSTAIAVVILGCWTGQ
jgi:hypothetical protein